MGLLKAGLGAAGGVMADQWKEFIYCESMPADVLACKGSKRTGGRSSNTRGEDNVISNGSVIAVNDGQGMLVVQNGKIIEVALEPGEFVFDTGSEPSVFSGNLGDSIKETFANIGSRFTFGGDAGKDQRVYFINTKEIIGNKYGTASPVPFRVVDNNIGLDVDISVRCNGEYSYRITNPLLFYTNVCGNVTDSYTRDKIDSQLKSELLTALQPAFAKISEMGIRYSAIPGHTTELARALNEILSADWRDLRGVEIVSFGVNSIAASQEDEQMIKDLQKAAVMRDPTMAAANIASAQSDAMRAAAANPNGAMAGFMGMGMAGGMMGQPMDATMYQQQMQQNMMNQQAAQAAPQQAAPAAAPTQAAPENGWTCACGTKNTGKFCANCGQPKPEPKPAADSWKCSCGTENTGKFCANCGSPKPEQPVGWTCSCGAVNKGKFCAECGKPKPASEPLYKCDKCGWEPEDPKNPPKFCPECGDPFNDNDIQK